MLGELTVPIYSKNNLGEKIFHTHEIYLVPLIKIKLYYFFQDLEEKKKKEKKKKKYLDTCLLV